MSGGAIHHAIDPGEFRTALARLGAAVNLITTDGADGRHGMTASAVCSVTDSPPTILVCVNRASAANARLKRNGVLCVNVLGGGHEELSRRFAGGSATVAERFADAGLWGSMATGSPVLVDAPVALDCAISEISEVGTHSVFFCEVRAVAVSENRGALIYYDRSYHALSATAPV